MANERQNDNDRRAQPNELLAQFETLKLRAKFARMRAEEAIGHAKTILDGAARNARTDAEMAAPAAWTHCPKCHAISRTPWPTTFGASHRYFECLNCGHVWTVTPPGPSQIEQPSPSRKSAP